MTRAPALSDRVVCLTTVWVPSSGTRPTQAGWAGWAAGRATWTGSGRVPHDVLGAVLRHTTHSRGLGAQAQLQVGSIEGQA